MDIKDLLKEGLVEEVRDKSYEAAPNSYKVIHQPKPCDDCGQIVVERIVNIRKNLVPFPHYKAHCNICKLYQNPETGKYDLNSSQIQYYYRNTYK